MNLLDLIFPKDLYCVSCGRPLPPRDMGGVALCARCADEIGWVTVGGRRCEKCGKPLSETNPASLCGDCAAGTHIFGKGYACARYAGRAAELVRAMKYRGRAYFADTLAALMAARFFAEADGETGELPFYDFVVAVPMSRKKRETRGYDQAALLARRLACRIDILYLNDALTRTLETDVMSSLSADGRRKNLSGAFELSRDEPQTVAGKRFLLVDDVYTTGSSVDACAETLLAADAAAVDFIVFAIGADAHVYRRDEDRNFSETKISPGAKLSFL